MALPDHIEELLKRLEAEEVPDFAPGLRHTCPINPDGPEAAKLIRDLAERVERLEGALREIAETVQITRVRHIARAALTPEQER